MSVLALTASQRWFDNNDVRVKEKLAWGVVSPSILLQCHVLSTSQTQGTFFSVNYNWVNSICHKNCASFPHKVLSILKIKPAPPLYKVLFWVCFFNQLHKFLIFNLFIILIKIWETIVNRHEHFFFFANIIVFFPWVM